MSENIIRLYPGPQEPPSVVVGLSGPPAGGIENLADRLEKGLNTDTPDTTEPYRVRVVDGGHVPETTVSRAHLEIVPPPDSLALAALFRQTITGNGQQGCVDGQVPGSATHSLCQSCTIMVDNREVPPISNLYDPSQGHRQPQLIAVW